MAEQRITLTGDDSPRFNPDGTPRLSEIDERIEDMKGRGWELFFKSPPIVTERKVFRHKAGKTYGAQKKFLGSESRATVKAVMRRGYDKPTGGGRYGNKNPGTAI